MEKYTALSKYGDTVSVSFYIEKDFILAIGDKLNTICEEAYMNGYNWDALLQYYLAQTAPELLDGLDSDPEAGMYTAHYALTPENELKAEKLVHIIQSLIEREEDLCRLVREHGGEIEWD